jgi:hypothetical protein
MLGEDPDMKPATMLELFLPFAIAIVGFAPHASAQLCSQDIDPSGMSSTGDRFGSSVGLGDLFAVVGSAGDDTAASNAGSASLYSRNPITSRLDFMHEVTASDAAADDGFGTSAAVSGSVVVIGAPYNDAPGGNAGAAYVFRNVGGIWTEAQKLTASNAAVDHLFGSSVAIDGNRIVVGRNGAAYIFEYNGIAWNEIDELPALGAAVAISGDFVAVAGAVLRFDSFLNIWVQEAALNHNGAVPHVAINGDLVGYTTMSFISSPPYTVHSIALQRRNATSGSWASAGSIDTSAIGSTRFAIAGDHLFVKSYGVGRLDIYSHVSGGWPLERTIEFDESGAAPFDGVVALVGYTLVGSPQWSISRGRAYLVDLACDPISATFCYQPIANSTGATARLDVLGSRTLVANDATLVASLLPLSTFGFFLTSRTSGLTVAPGSAVGNLCLAGNIGRFVGPGQIKNSGAIGRFDLALDLTALPTPTGSIAANVGETWRFQAWHRDANPTLQSNFTDAAQVTWQ